MALVEYWYNTSDHSSNGRSPFEALYGYVPCHLGVSAADCSVSDLAVFIKEKELMNRLLQQHLLHAKQRMKRQADKGRSERSFNVGDLVFLKLQPYVQSSLAPCANQKLAFKFFGPYKILARVGEVAYKLELPPQASVHPVFHVSQLKQTAGTGHQVTSSLPPSEGFQVPEAILQRRTVTRGIKSVPQVQVRWSSLLDSMATWEDLEALQQQFLLAPAWGQAGSQGEGDVSTSGPRRSKRPNKPNPRVAGPEWHK